MEIFKEISSVRGILRGMIHVPEKLVYKTPIFIIHGYFSSHRVGPNRLYVKIARNLESLGYLVCRFDCYGVGESDGDFSEVSLESEISDHTLIIKSINEQYNFEYFSVIAHSMGCNISIKLANYFKEKITKLLLIAPDVERRNFDQFFSKSQLTDLEENGFTYRKGLFIDYSFIKEIRNYGRLFDEAKKIAQYGILKYIFYGDKDELYSKESFKKLSSCLIADMVKITNGNHNFLDITSSELLIKQISKIFEEDK